MKKYWYLAYCHPKEEERAISHLKNQGMYSYYPLVLTRKILRGKMVEKTEPMFPRYLFIHVDIHEFSPMKIRSTRGISRVIGHGEKWNIVPAELIYQLMRNEDSDELRDVVSRLPKHGQQVLIEEGPFKGLQAIYQEPDGELRAILLLSFLNKDISDSFDNKSYRCMTG